MIVDRAIIFGERKRFLKFDPIEHPVALQLGGNDPKLLAEATKIAVDFGYDEINLNVGCPSTRVKSGNFGAALMKKIDLVRSCVEAMKASAGKIPVTVKSRIGVDDQNPDEVLPEFITKVASSGCSVFIIHARKALLGGLSPKDNRKIPPLQYPLVYEMQNKFPELDIILNGGLTELEEVESVLQNPVSGVMIGREAYENPSILLTVDNKIFDQKEKIRSMKDAIRNMIEYCNREQAEGTAIKGILKHLKGAFKGQANSREFKRVLFCNETTDLEKLEKLSNLVPIFC
jgi:tRNA-dihydrouridine synthase A|tara:strand:+ start:245 stop:1108 length:864 start_codon:yes stop_codon:yes gene_type:complete